MIHNYGTSTCHVKHIFVFCLFPMNIQLFKNGAKSKITFPMKIHIISWEIEKVAKNSFRWKECSSVTYIYNLDRRPRKKSYLNLKTMSYGVHFCLRNYIYTPTFDIFSCLLHCIDFVKIHMVEKYYFWFSSKITFFMFYIQNNLFFWIDDHFEIFFCIIFWSHSKFKNFSNFTTKTPQWQNMWVEKGSIITFWLILLLSKHLWGIEGKYDTWSGSANFWKKKLSNFKIPKNALFSSLKNMVSLGSADVARNSFSPQTHLFGSNMFHLSTLFAQRRKNLLKINFHAEFQFFIKFGPKLTILVSKKKVRFGGKRTN